MKNEALSLFTFCPNCTKSESWPSAKQGWTYNKGILRENFNPFEDCCNPLEWKRFKVSYNGVKPAIIRLIYRKIYHYEIMIKT